MTLARALLVRPICATRGWVRCAMSATAASISAPNGEHANFGGADLRGADLCGARLLGADFSNATCAAPISAAPNTTTRACAAGPARGAKGYAA